jgi:hypothetical protein
MESISAELRARFGRACEISRRATSSFKLAFGQLVAELRHLNGVGANASSRRVRVRIVKQKLARRGDGPNRCC